MKSAELVCFRRNEMGLYIADADINSVAIYLYLQKNGIEVKQYYNNSLLSAEDIVEDLLSEYLDTVCFLVTEENRDFVYGIANFFAENEEDTELIFILAEDLLKKVPFGENIQVWDVSEKLPVSLGSDDVSQDSELSVSKIYRDKVVPVNMSGSLGIILNAKCSLFNCTFINHPDDVIEELNYVSKYLSYHNHIVLYSDNLQEYPYLNELNEKVSKYNYKQSIQIMDFSNYQSVDEQNQYRAIKNGIRAFYTGMYYDNEEMAYTKHIRCSEEDLTESLFQDLSAHNAANNGIYVTGKNADKQYKAVKEMAVKSGYLFSNFVSYNELEVKDSYQVKINGVDAGTYRVVAYADAKELNEKNAYISLDSEAGLNEFLDDVKEYRNTGAVKYNRMWKYDLVDKCRWINFRSCSLDKLYRFTVKDGEVCPCITSNQSIGNTGTMHFPLIRNACVHIESEQVERKCDKCGCKLSCPKCSMLPEYISKERYCEIMHSNLDLEKYFQNMMTIRTFFEYCSIKKLKDVTPDMMKFATAKNAISVDAEPVAESKLNEYIMLGKVNGQEVYVIFNWRTRQALSVNNTLFMIAELLLKGQDHEMIIKYMAKAFGVENEIAKANVEECLSFLREKEYVKDEC